MVDEILRAEKPLGPLMSVVVGPTASAGRPAKEARQRKWHEAPNRTAQPSKRARGADLPGYSRAERAAAAAIPPHRYAHIGNFTTDSRTPVGINGLNQRLPLTNVIAIDECDQAGRMCCACYEAGSTTAEPCITGGGQFCQGCNCILHTRAQCEFVHELVEAAGSSEAPKYMCGHCHAKAHPAAGAAFGHGGMHGEGVGRAGPSGDAWRAAAAAASADVTGQQELQEEDGFSDGDFQPVHARSTTQKKGARKKCKHCGAFGHTKQTNCNKK
jgi:hypothetical protein